MCILIFRPKAQANLGMASFVGLFFLGVFLLMSFASATQFKVGGSMGWSVPTGPNAMSYNQWAERNRFMIGDSLLFVYPANEDSVLLVDKDAYTNCNTSSYIMKFSDGSTLFTFNRSGPFFFIGGDSHNCLRKQSLVIVVMANHSNRISITNQSSMAPSPSPLTQSNSNPPPPLSSSGEVPPPAPASISTPAQPLSSYLEVPPPSPASISPPAPPPPTSVEVPPPSPASIPSSPPPPSSSAEGPPPVAPAPIGAGEASSSPPPQPNDAAIKVAGFFKVFVGILFFVL